MNKRIKKKKHKLIPVSLVKEMLYKEGHCLAKITTGDVDEDFNGDLTFMVKSMLFNIREYEEGRDWNIFNQ